MILLCDIGNSRCKLGLCDAGAQGLYPKSVSAYPVKNASHNDLSLRDNFKRFKLNRAPGIERIFVASVRRPGLTDQITSAMKEVFKVSTQQIESVSVEWDAHDLHSHYDKIGVDRFLALLGMRQTVSDSAGIVIDCGTTTTIDLMDASGTHCGGMIIPGIQMMRDSLSQGADLLPKNLDDILIDVDLNPLACDTVNAINQGCVNILRHGIRNILQALDSHAHVVITGGGARRIAYKSWELREYLVLEGLAAYARDRLR